ncbi:nuclear transport factor 2 family protein [Actinoplanes sp. NPDC051633]|uniref:nuclear transport factor 2 family protein n=1 Tax=Actinoplanes sp. NPDC051633 TaxID=3155670 RepID=UPI00341E7A59
MRDVKPIFDAIDSQNADDFVAHLTEDVTFRFGNAEPVHGRAAVAEAVNGFWGTIGGLTHHVLNTWDVADTTICQIDVEYKRLDGNTVVTPNADILVFDGDLVKNWQIYIDVAPVYAP